MGDLGVFEADANAGKLSAEAAANAGFELEKGIDRAIFRAKERFGAYLANAQSKDDFNERWSEVKPQVIRVIADVVTPTPGVIRRVGAALRPVPAQAPKKDRPSSAKTARTDDHRDEVVPGSGRVIEPKDFTRVGATQKHAWSYDQGTRLYTSTDPMQKFACPGCGTEQDHLGFTHCAGCERTWNSWPVRQQSSAKTGASTYLLMAREIKMRGDQFKMAAAGNVKVAETPLPEKTAEVEKEAQMPMQQPYGGTMPGDNSGATGSPMPAEQPPTPMAAAGDPDHDGDVAGGITEGSPIDQIQDALEGAVMALKDVQMLSINPVLAKTAGAKVDTLRTAMDRFWGLHKQMNYVAGMLAKEANEAIRAMDPRITSEAEFVKGYTAASKNDPLPAKTGRAWLEGYLAFHKQSDSYSTGADIGRLTVPTGMDETAGDNEGSAFLDGKNSTPADENRGDAGPFDTSQPASQKFVSQMDQDNAAGQSRGDQGESSSIQPTSSRRSKR